MKLAFQPFVCGLRICFLVDAVTRASGFSSVELPFSGHLNWVLAVAWSPDGSRLASVARIKRIQ
jgi:WD40 repeat protein